MRRSGILAAVLAALLLPSFGAAAENLKLNDHLNFDRNGWQGFLITGDDWNVGVEPGVPNLIFFYADYCFNAKRVARSVVDLYGKYHGRVHFVPVDVITILNPERRDLAKTYYHGIFPHVTLLDENGVVVLDYTGELNKDILEGWIEAALRVEPRQTPPSALAARIPSGK